MTIHRAQDIDGCPADIKIFLKKCAVLLLFGSNDGLIRDLCLQVAAVQGLQPMDFSAADVIRQPATVVRALGTDSLFASANADADAGRCMIVIRDAGDALTTPLRQWGSSSLGWETLARRGLVVVCAVGSVNRRSRLVRWAESEEWAVPVVCYDDEPPRIRDIMQQRLTSHHVSVDAEALNRAAMAIAGDRMIVFSEIQKIRLYAGTATAECPAILNPDEMGSLVVDTAQQSLFEYVDDCCGGVLSHAVERQRIIGEQASSVGALSVLAAYLLDILHVQSRCREGATMREALTGTRTPLFFRRKKVFSDNCVRTPPALARKTLQAIADLTLAIKAGKMPAPYDVLSTRRLFFLLAHNQSLRQHRLQKAASRLSSQ